MIIGSIIDGIFKGTRYGVWGIAVLGILASAIMIFTNIGLGFGSVMISIALLLVSIAVTMLLMPKAIFKNYKLDKKKIVISVILLLVATAIAGIIYFVVGGFPALNLIFMQV